MTTLNKNYTKILGTDDADTIDDTNSTQIDEIEADMTTIETDLTANQAATSLNTTHRTSDGTDHANVVLADTHRLGDGSDHADVATNTSDIASHKAATAAHGVTGNIVGDTDAQTLANKTLTTPKIDSIAEETLDNGVTIDGVNLKDGEITTANSVGTANIADGAVTLAKTTGIIGADASGKEIRYGSAVVTTDATGLASITYSSAFATATSTVTVTSGDYTIGNLNISINGTSSTGFGVKVRIADTAADAASITLRVNYIAIGY